MGGAVLLATAPPPAAVFASAATGLAAAAAVRLLVRPRRPLADRVRPYAIAPLSALGLPAGDRAVRVATGGSVRAGRQATLPAAIRTVLGRGVTDQRLQRRLRQAGRHTGHGAATDQPGLDDLVVEHRLRQVLLGLAGAALGGMAGAAVGLGGLATLLLGALGAAGGAARPDAALQRSLDDRAARTRAELPAICQLLAIRTRAGGSVVAAVATTSQRCSGLLAETLTDCLAQHRAGRPLEEVLEDAAVATVEPQAARLYRQLAGAIRYGLDAAPELLRLARESREHHLTRLRRDATRRRGALLLPTVGLLAPLMLLFIAAPLPTLLGAVA